MRRRDALTGHEHRCWPLAGAQAAIQMLPQLHSPAARRFLAPTYNEYAPVLAAAGWQVEEAGDLDALAGADLAIVVNPNNPDGQRHDVKTLLALSSRVNASLSTRALPMPCPACRWRPSGEAGPVDPALFRQVLRARRLAARLRLGRAADVAALAAMAGPWPVSGAAVEIGRRACWTAPGRMRQAHASHAKPSARHAGAERELECGRRRPYCFRLYETPTRLPRRSSWRTPYLVARFSTAEPEWLRLGLPRGRGDENGRGWPARCQRPRAEIPSTSRCCSM